MHAALIILPRKALAVLSGTGEGPRAYGLLLLLELVLLEGN
jgi:hypothetical protein